MKVIRRELRSFALISVIALFLAGCAAGRGYSQVQFPNPPDMGGQASGSSMVKTETAVFSGGCFWGVQGVFERLKGVERTFAGYSGGSADTAHYEIVSTGTTGHAESVEVVFDPSVISYGTLLKVFFSVAHDPTELNFQGPDHGTQYRSVIFYANDAQKKLAEAYIKELDAARVFPKPIVTQVAPLKAFYRAEEYHQHFMDKNPYYPYIVYWDVPKVRELAKLYPNLISKKYRGES